MSVSSLPRLAAALAASLFVFGTQAAPTPADFLANAECIALVQAEDAAEKPAPKGKMRVRVKEILKGVNTAQTLLVPENALKPGDSALLLFPFRPPAESDFALRPERNSPPSPRIWPIGAEGTIEARGIQTNLADVRSSIAARTPEEEGLNALVIDALLFPEKLEAFAGTDAAHAAYADYVSLVIALRGLDRSESALEALLESPDKDVRAAAEAKLKTLPLAPAPSRWPAAVPESFEMPADAFPESLLKPLQDGDIAALAKAIPAWLDSGVMRDRQMRFAESISSQASDRCGLSTLLRNAAYPPGAPILAHDFASDQKIPAGERMKALALLAELWNYDRVVAERAQAIADLQAAKPGDENVRRAAFWEPRNVNIPVTVGATALRKLPADASPEGVALLRMFFFSRLDQETLGAARMAVQANNQPFIDILAERVKTKQADLATTWAARLLCQEGNAQGIPLMLGWLQDSDAQVRSNATVNLCWIPRPEIVEPLLKQLDTEQDARVRRGLLNALAQTGDPRTLDVLLAAVQPGGSLANADVVRGLARIRDPKALPALAALAIELSDRGSNTGNSRGGRSQPMEMLSAVVNAFGYISNLYPAQEPGGFGENSGVGEQEVKDELELIRKWADEQKAAPAPK